MMHVILYFAAVDFLVHKLWLKLAVNCLYRNYFLILHSEFFLNSLTSQIHLMTYINSLQSCHILLVNWQSLPGRV